MLGSPWDLVTVVIVTYNSGDILSKCLDHVSAAKKIVVVDNASRDDTLKVARDYPGPVTLIVNDRNLGFGTASNQGFAQADTPFGLLLNPDCMVMPGCLESLVAAAQDFPNAAAISPLMRNEEGVQDIWLRAPRQLDSHQYFDEVAGPLCTGNASGAILLWRMDLWRIVGGFDATFFLYGEDHDLCMRTEDKGYPMIVEPSAQAIHLGGKSSVPSLKSRIIRDWHIHWGSLEVEARWQERAKARKRAWSMVRYYGGKSLLYVLLIRPKRVVGNFVKAHAALTWVLGGSAWSGPGANR